MTTKAINNRFDKLLGVMITLPEPPDTKPLQRAVADYGDRRLKARRFIVTGQQYKQPMSAEFEARGNVIVFAERPIWYLKGWDYEGAKAFIKREGWIIAELPLPTTDDMIDAVMQPKPRKNATKKFQPDDDTP